MSVFDEIKNDAEEVGKLAREVVAKRVIVLAALAALLNVALAYHWITPDLSEYVTTWVTRGIDALATVAGVVAIRKAVTPSVDPKNDTGTPLMPVSQAEALAANAAYEAANQDEAVVIEPTDTVESDSA